MGFSRLEWVAVSFSREEFACCSKKGSVTLQTVHQKTET